MRNVQQSIEKSIEADRQMMRDNPAYKIPEYSLLNAKHQVNQTSNWATSTNKYFSEA